MHAMSHTHPYMIHDWHCSSLDPATRFKSGYFYYAFMDGVWAAMGYFNILHRLYIGLHSTSHQSSQLLSSLRSQCSAGAYSYAGIYSCLQYCTLNTSANIIGTYDVIQGSLALADAVWVGRGAYCSQSATAHGP